MEPNYRISEKILNQVQKISELSTQLSLETRELHLRKENRIRSIQSSLAIENNSLSLEQVTDLIEGKRVLGPPKDIHEVQNAYQAYERAFSFDPYSVQDFLSAHLLLTQGLVKEPGKFRSGNVGIYDPQGNVVHMGAHPQFVPALVEDLFTWAKNSQISPIVKSCIVHFELEIIHPFEDGNGRMGRLWQSLILSRWNPLYEWLPVESVIFAYQQGYYDAIGQSNRENDSTVFTEFMLDSILETLEEYNSATPLPAGYEGLKPKEVQIYDVLQKSLEPGHKISARTVAGLIGLSPATTRRYLALFVEKGLLQTGGSTKSRLYWLAK